MGVGFGGEVCGVGLDVRRYGWNGPVVVITRVVNGRGGERQRGRQRAPTHGSP